MLEIDRVSKAFGAKTALDGVSFAVRPGEVFGLVGSSGAGKTTTMRIALGVLAADSGEVRLDGRPVTDETRAQIGYLPEERGLYPRMKVFDQLVYLAELHGLSTNEAYGAAELWVARFGLGPWRTEAAQKLSLGNRQRVQLAAALVHNPAVLVLDEPFSGLDPLVVDVLSKVLREKASAGASVLFSSHQLDLVERLCDRVGIIRDGRMVAVGTVDELTRDAARRLVVTAPGARPGWAATVPGARVLEGHGATTVLELSPSADDQAVLAAALATGPVTEFSHRRRTLSELFHDAVATPEGPR
ncbi:ABC transporter ATP-binding protein [Amycolatopsis jejuensis]|uniref:ABC transporter ATP-binding protein n=1 Tax=Amycolatopsis jejuensis TaxID=330084 RepID=UPI000525762C|nr:ATP-binding cassette domain-containing protein [Amycolatopsis jejuensis]